MQDLHVIKNGVVRWKGAAGARLVATSSDRIHEYAKWTKNWILYVEEKYFLTCRKQVFIYLTKSKGNSVRYFKFLNSRFVRGGHYV